MPFLADYYNGLSSRAQTVSVNVDSGIMPEINFLAEDGTHTYEVSQLHVQAKLGNSKRLIDLPDGGRLEAGDISELEARLSSAPHVFSRFLHYLENHLGWVLLSLLLTVLAGWGFLRYGVPKLAEYVVNVTPPEMETSLGKQILKGFDDKKLGYFDPSKTQAVRQKAIAVTLTKMCAALTDCPNYRLEFRDGGIIGANAFALPGGIMVVTDQLIALAKSDTEVVAVLAHELGHVKKRHVFRQSIQCVISGLMLAAVTGDVSSAASGISGVLIQMRYSQDHETEADNFALQALQKACLPPKAYADILQRLDDEVKEIKQEQAKDSDNQELKQKLEAISSMLSTHPDTLSRIKPFKEAKLNCIQRN